MVIGGGGAARSAIYALRTWMRVRDIYVVNRCKTEVDAVFSECAAKGFGAGLVRVDTVEDAMRLDGPGAIVACVPDFPPKTEDERRTRNIIEIMLGKGEKGAMLEMCYNPTPFTELGALAEGLGWKVILGTEAMIWQGLEQVCFHQPLSRSSRSLWQLTQVLSELGSVLDREGHQRPASENGSTSHSEGGDQGSRTELVALVFLVVDLHINWISIFKERISYYTMIFLSLRAPCRQPWVQYMAATLGNPPVFSLFIVFPPRSQTVR
jgi:hypothetical protein